MVKSRLRVSGDYVKGVMSFFRHFLAQLLENGSSSYSTHLLEVD